MVDLALMACLALPQLAYAEQLGTDSLSSPLVIPGSLVEAEQLQAESQTTRSSPAAAAARAASATAYAGLGTTQAAELAETAFPATIRDQNGGLPRRPSGEQVTGFLTPATATVDLGKRRARRDRVRRANGRQRPRAAGRRSTWLRERGAGGSLSSSHCCPCKYHSAYRPAFSFRTSGCR